MMRRTIVASHTLALVSLLAFSDGALAKHGVIYSPRVEAFANSQTHQGPYVVVSSAHTINGGAGPNGNYVGNAGSSSTSGNAAYVIAQTTQDGNNGQVPLHSDAIAITDMARGELHASVGATGPNNFGTPLGFATARLDDTLYFTNTSGSAQLVNFVFSFDGRLFDPNGGNPGGNVSLDFSCAYYLCFNDANQAITYAGSPNRPADDYWSYYFSMNSGYFAENIYGGQTAAPYFNYGLNQPHANGVIDGYIGTTLVIPTGTTSLGVRGWLNLDCRGGSSCDFGHTGSFHFGAIPDGVSWTSESGVFLTGLAAGVPEPATWAMMILGFGVIGGAMRRRQAGIQRRVA